MAGHHRSPVERQTTQHHHHTKAPSKALPFHRPDQPERHNTRRSRTEPGRQAATSRQPTSRLWSRGRAVVCDDGRWEGRAGKPGLARQACWVEREWQSTRDTVRRAKHLADHCDGRACKSGPSQDTQAPCGREIRRAKIDRVRHTRDRRVRKGKGSARPGVSVRDSATLTKHKTKPNQNPDGASE